MKDIPKAVLAEDRVIFWNSEKGKEIFEDGYYGKFFEDRLELALVEAAYLMETGVISLVDQNNEELSLKEFIGYAEKIDQRFGFRYAVYKDLRKKQLPTRTGFKFGCDFRVYARGVKPMKRGPKAPIEHTKWVVFAVPKSYACSFAELSRAVRLAHNIRANMLWAVVNSRNEVNYYSVTFFKP